HQLGVSVGTVNSYLLMRVDPLNCRLVIQQRLAALNGVDIQELFGLYETGDWDGFPRRAPQLVRTVIRPLRRGQCRHAVIAISGLPAVEWRERVRQTGGSAVLEPACALA
ncbi:MAG: hypothetical protein VKM34_10730, partial [Cyanobacteriota bacterium]|nr:hypothetical protein [Cyanobacteriota bacterium]